MVEEFERKLWEKQTYVGFLHSPISLKVLFGEGVAKKRFTEFSAKLKNSTG